MNEMDTVELEAISRHAEVPFDRVVGMSEADLLRAAHLREYLGIPGANVQSTLLFRDKAMMKAEALRFGIKVARYRQIESSVELYRFTHDHGYPVIVKPLRGRGSSGTEMIRDDSDLRRFLSSGPFAKSFGLPALLVEEFVEGNIYHVDGWWSEESARVMSASRYVNSCLDFVGGSFLGSHTLSEESPLREKLVSFAKRLLESFPTPKNCLFHIEVFVTPSGDLVLCEAASRLGGNGINEEVRLSTGVDIKMEYLRSEFGQITLARPTAPQAKGEKIIGRLLVPPMPGKLSHFPSECSHPAVLNYACRGVVGRSYSKMTMSNDEIASFLVETDSEIQMQGVLSHLAEWFTQSCEVVV
jgi:biotin carboxylase